MEQSRPIVHFDHSANIFNSASLYITNFYNSLLSPNSEFVECSHVWNGAFRGVPNICAYNYSRIIIRHAHPCPFLAHNIIVDNVTKHLTKCTSTRMWTMISLILYKWLKWLLHHAVVLGVINKRFVNCIWSTAASL